jgi:hypothetical protein
MTRDHMISRALDAGPPPPSAGALGSPAASPRAASGLDGGEPAHARAPFVDDVFDAVVDLDTVRREAELAARCRDFPSVEREVRALLAADHPPPEPLAAGVEIGTCRLVEQLGRGGTATVWRAFDTHLQAWTALKILDPRAGDALDAVLREARAASAILSDHVVRIRGCGRTPGGRSYVDMQLCAEYRADTGTGALVMGRSLADDPPASTAEAVRLVAEACRGVEAGHRVGVLHRDLKPANVLVTPISRRALVTDFGLAAAPMFPPPTLATPATATVSVQLEGTDGTVVGTPPYLAPELLRGQAPSRASDVYALGATLYALVAGHPPYVPTGKRSPIPMLDVVAQVREGAPPVLGKSRLARIVAVAMARDPAARYPTAAAFGADLERWLADEPTSVDRGVTVRLGLFLSRNRAVAGTAALLGAMLAVSGVAVVALEGRRAALEEGTLAAEVRREAAIAQADQAERVRDQANAERDAAVVEKGAAVADALAAIEARNAAEQGQTSAEERAAAEIKARRKADQERADAEARKAEAETALRAETIRRLGVEDDLADAERDLGLARAEGAQTAAALEAEQAARADAEAKLAEERRLRAQAEADRDAALAEVARLNGELAAQASAVATPR